MCLLFWRSLWRSLSNEKTNCDVMGSNFSDSLVVGASKFYYNNSIYKITHGADEFHTYTWVDTRDGRFVFNAVTGVYVKELDDNEDPAKKYNEDISKQIKEELKRLSEEN